MPSALHRTLLPLLLIGGCATLVSCQDETGNWLDGSLADSYDLRFTSVRARLYPSELSIEYVADAEDEGEKVALRVTLNVVQAPPEVGVVYDLFADGNVGRGEGYGSGLPDLDSGTLELEEFVADPGNPCVGEFEAVFNTADDSQYTLRGGFEAELEIVDL